MRKLDKTSSSEWACGFFQRSCHFLLPTFTESQPGHLAWDPTAAIRSIHLKGPPVPPPSGAHAPCVPVLAWIICSPLPDRLLSHLGFHRPDASHSSPHSGCSAEGKKGKAAPWGACLPACRGARQCSSPAGPSHLRVEPGQTAKSRRTNNSRIPPGILV